MSGSPNDHVIADQHGEETAAELIAPAAQSDRIDIWNEAVCGSASPRINSKIFVYPLPFRLSNKMSQTSSSRA
jgi:hypothetical protein